MSAIGLLMRFLYIISLQFLGLALAAGLAGTVDRCTDYGHMKGYIPNSLRPKFKFKSQINIWDVVINI